MEAVRSLNPDGELKRYPGSPALAHAALRADDRLVLNELHPTAFANLGRWARKDERIAVHQRDSLEAMRALVRAAHLGIAMQLTNICRDVAEDWQRGRLYLPAALLEARGISGLRPGEPLPVAPIGEVVAGLLALADHYYRSGDRGIAALPWRAALAVRSARGVYSAIGDRIVALARRIFVGHETRVAQLRNGLHHEVVVQLLRIVDLVAARIPAGVEVSDPLEVIPDIPDDVAVHDLRVVDVEEDFDAR